MSGKYAHPAPEPERPGIRPTVTAIVLNWCGEAVTRDCLDSLLKSTYPRLRILLVDNGSEDGSGARLHADYPDIDYLQTGANLGYAGGNNRGIERALEGGADYVLVTNNDTVLDAGAVALLVEAAEGGDGGPVGGVVPKIVFHDRPDRIWYAGGNFSPFRGSGMHWREGEPDTPDADSGVREVTFVTGCCVLVPAPALRDVGGFTEALFAYEEDADLSLRLRRAGYHLLYQPAARVLHHAKPAATQPSPFQIRQAGVNRRWVMRRHFSWPRRLPFLLRFGATRVLLLARYVLGGDGPRARAVVDGVFGRVRGGTS